MLVCGLLAASAAGCAPHVPAEKLHAAWVINDTKVDRRKASLKPDELVAATTGGFFRLYPNGVASIVCAGSYREGRWQWDPAESRLRVNSERGVEEFAVEFFGTSSASITLQPGVVVHVEADRLNYGDADPYSPELNRWRVPARSAQTFGEIDQRLIGMLRFLTAHLQSAAAREVETLNLSTLPTPFIFAANGIALQRPNELRREWVALFASREEAIFAAMRLGAHFRNIHVPQMANRFERDALIFSQVASALQTSASSSTAQ